MIFRKAGNYNEENFEHRWIYDVQRIQKVARDNGYEADLDACAYLWDEYSDDYAAGWMGLPENDDDLWEIVINKAEQLSYRIKGFEAY
jgi:hypothetical protein